MEQVWTDIRYAWRAWRQAPVATLGILILLALGIGSVAALFSPLYSLVLAPLPFPGSDRLVRIGGDIPLLNGYSFTFERRERLTPIFEHLMAYAPVDVGAAAQVQFSSTRRTVDVTVQSVSPEFFETLGVTPRAGHGFLEERPESTAVVLSDHIWRSEFPGGTDAIGTAVRFLGRSFTVVGVMPFDFDFPTGTDLWVPMGTAPDSHANVQFVGRLRSGLSMGPAATALTGMGLQRGQDGRGVFGKDGPVLQPLSAFLRGDRRPLLWILWAVSILFLLLASAGAGNLLLAQGARRRPEMIIRLALGASRARLIRQHLTETLLVVALSGLVAMWLSTIAGRWLKGQLPEMRDGQVFVPATIGLVAMLAVAVTILCGLAPAWLATRTPLTVPRKASVARNRLFTSRRGRASSRELLVGAQLALALVLLITAGLLFQSLTARLNMTLGLDAHNVAVVQPVLRRPPGVDAITTRFSQESQRASGADRHAQLDIMTRMQQALEPDERAENARNRRFFQEAEARLRHERGVVSIGVMQPAPFTAAAIRALQNPGWVSGLDAPADGSGRPAYVTGIVGRASPGAFDVLGVRPVAGRTFTPADVAGELLTEEAIQFPPPGDNSRHRDYAGVAIVNEGLAHRLWSGQSAIGKRFHDRGLAVRTVVGVIPGFHQTGYSLTIAPAAYYPFTGIKSTGSFVVRLADDASLARFGEDAVPLIRALTPDLAGTEAQTMQRGSDSSLANLRLALILLTTFSLLGTVVAALGVYAAATLMAAERAREMAVRLALGASRSAVCNLTLWRTVRLALWALPAGGFVSWVLNRQLSMLLFQVDAADGSTYAVTGAFLLMIALVSGLRPALRTASLDPAAALRCD